MTTSGETKRRAAGGIEFFDQQDAADLFSTGTMSLPEMIDPDLTLADAAELAPGSLTEVLFRSEEHGFSLVRAQFAPDYVLPRHSHSVDCTYYVVSGEVHLGNRIVAAGSGFFIPAGAPYGYSAGPEGVEVLEFRGEVSFDMKIVEKADRMAKIVEHNRAHREQWAAPASG